MTTLEANMSIDGVIDLSQSDDLDPSQGLEGLFRFQAKIVGKRFYKEKLNDGELVYLVREPNNPYDRNAIKVESINHQQVGHISAGSSYPNIAACLSPILDYSLDPTKPKTVGVLAESISVEGRHSQYSSMCVITLVGDPLHHGIISQHLCKHKLPHRDLKNNRNALGYVDTERTKPKKPVSVEPVSVVTEQQKMASHEISDSMNAVWEDLKKDVENISLSESDASILDNCIKSKLLSHQKVGVAWMLQRESYRTQDELPPLYCSLPGGKFSHCLTRHNYTQRPKNIAGGFLLDSMGLGKSLQLLSLIIAHPPPGRNFLPNPITITSTNESLCVQVTPDKENSPSDVLNQQDLTQKTNAKLKALCKERGLSVSGNKNTLIDRLMNMNQIPVSSTESTRVLPTPTMIVCPLSVISSWQEQLSLHVCDGTVKMLTYHDKSRTTLTLEDLTAADIVLTTYDVLVAEFQQKGYYDAAKAEFQQKGYYDEAAAQFPQAKKQKTISSLWDINWWRIILDEAHIIRNTSTRRCKAAIDLKANFRWIVTGTAIVNTVADLEAPCQFLRLEPFSSDVALFKRYLVRPIKAGNTEAFAMIRALLKPISLRREKDEVLDFQLPIKNEIKVLIDLNEKEQDAYSAIHEVIKEYQTDAVATSGTAGTPNTHIMLSLITRLRQACLDLRLVPAEELVNMLSKGSNGKTNVERLTLEEKMAMLSKINELFIAAGVGVSPSNSEDSASVDVEDCMVCFEPLQESNVIIFRGCKHTFCQVCVDKFFTTESRESSSGPKLSKFSCPMCRSPVSRDDCLSFTALQSSCASAEAKLATKAEASDIKTVSSSKTLAILKELAEVRKRGEKTVIFSSFRGYLDILSDALTEAGYSHCRIDGRVPQKRRGYEIERFSTDESVSVILCSLKACGVGITLTRANNIFLTDLWWAPSVDLQAIDRVHRIGQTRAVNVLRFLVRDSIDEKIFDLQLKKIVLAKEVAKPLTAKEVSDLRAQDMLALLN